jgi:hypothetical protein
MSDGIVKLYKNPHRNEVEDFEKNQPQYKQLGMVPNYSNDKVSIKPEVDLLNPRTRVLSIRETVNKPTQQVPPVGLVNVGNNMEHTWSGVDGEIYDDVSDLELDPNQKMIDNNVYVEPAKFEPSEYIKKQMDIVLDKIPAEELQEFAKEAKKFLTEKDLREALTAELQEKISSLPLIKEDEYILMIDGVVIDIGSLEKVEEQANLLVFGDHELCAGHPVPAENLLILKRVKIKIGLFLE